MSRKTLFILVILLVVLAGLWKFYSRQTTAPNAAAADAAGTLLGPVDMSTVSAITLEGSAATTHLAQAEGEWRVAEKEDYPANFDHLRELIRSIDAMEAGQSVPAGTDHLAEFGLIADETSTPTRVTLQHAAGQTVLAIGHLRAPNPDEPYWGRVPGRYVRVDEGPVRLLKDDIRMAEADPDAWWDRNLLKLAAEDVQRLEVTSETETYALERGEDQVLKIVDAAEEEETEANAVNRLLGALRNLRADEMLPKDTEITGASRLEVLAAGVTYSLRIGEPRSDKNNARPIQIVITPTDDIVPEAAAGVARQAKRLVGNTYLIPSYQADQLLPAKTTLISTPPPAPPPVPGEEKVLGDTTEAAPEAEVTAANTEEPTPESAESAAGQGDSVAEEPDDTPETSSADEPGAPPPAETTMNP